MPDFKVLKRIIVSIIFLVLTLSVNAQSIELFNIDHSEYPVIKANFKAISNDSTPIYNLTQNQVNIKENNDSCEIVYFKSPAQYPSPLSVILVFDVSGSMEGERLEIAKQAGKSFINEIKGSKFELAITTFSKSSYINSDFTTNINKLNTTIDQLNSISATKYDSAFLQPKTGIFELAKNAKYKKTIVFMTDGLSKANTDSIINEANRNNISIYCTTIQLEMTDILRSISTQTGGDYFPKINSPKKAKEIYARLYRQITSSDMGTIKWLAPGLCEHDRSINLKINTLQTQSGYSLKKQIQRNFEVQPKSILITNKKPDKEIIRSVLLKSVERPVVINNIYSDSPESIKIEDLDFPFTINPKESRNIRVYIKNNDSTRLKGKITIETENCMEKTELILFFLQKGEIEVVTPSGGEIYAVGNDINITWKGVPENQEVALFYRNSEMPWKRIGTGFGLSHLWTAPNDTGNNLQVKVQTLEAGEKTITNRIGFKNGITNVYDISSDGTMVVTRDRYGTVKVTHIETAQTIFSFRESEAKFIFFSPDNKSLILFYRSLVKIKSIYTQNEDLMMTRSAGRLLSSYCSNTGDEYLLLSNIDPYTYPDDMRKVTDLAHKKSFLFSNPKSKIEHAAFSSDGKRCFMLLKDNQLIYAQTERKRLKKIDNINPGVKRILVSPYGKYCLIEYPLNARVINAENGRTTLFTNNDVYLRFSADGDKMMTIDSSRQVNIRNLNNGDIIFSIKSPRTCNFSLSGNLIYYIKENYLHIYDLQNKKELVNKFFNGMNQIKISPDDVEFLVTRNGIAEVYNMQTEELVSKLVTNAPGGLYDAFFDVNSNIITNSSSIIQLWKPLLNYDPGISNPFSVVAPQPDILSEFDFGESEINTTKDAYIAKLITNNTKFNIKIESIETDDENGVFELISGVGSFILPAGKSHDVELEFSPNETTLYTGNIIVSTPDSSFKCKLTGKGITKKVELNSHLIDFGIVTVNQSKDSVINVFKNISNIPISVRRTINFGPDKTQFSILNKQEKTLVQPGKYLQVNVRFHPNEEGRTSGCIRIETNYISEPILTNLLGEGRSLKNKIIYGQVRNSLDSTGIEAIVHGTDLNSDKNIIAEKTASNGNYRFSAMGYNNLLLFAEKNGFISGSENVSPNIYFALDSIEKNIYLTPLKEGSRFSLNGVFFAFAKADLLSVSINDLQRVVAILNANQNLKLEIHGHTDNVGSDEANLELSNRRANSVKQFLVEHGIDSDRLSIKYFGESKPVSTNETDEGRQQNRRVEFVIGGM